MNERLQKILFLIVGAINFFPVTAIRSQVALNNLYGIDITDNNVLILLQHRALMFGLVGSLTAAAAFKAHLRHTAIVVGLISMIGFTVLAISKVTYNDEILRIVMVDVVAAVLLLIAAGLNRNQRVQAD